MTRTPPSHIQWPIRWLAIGMFTLPLLGVAWTYLLGHNLAHADKQLQLHNEVLAGNAPTVYQYQMPLHCAVLEAVSRLGGSGSARRFSIYYTIYYTLGYWMACWALYAFSRRYAPPLASAAGCVNLVALLPFFCYDSYFHPGDPWGLALAGLLARSIQDNSPRWKYVAILGASGFVWEKHVLIPVSRAIVEWRRPGSRWRVISECGVGSVVAGFGQVFFRLVYGHQAAGVGSLWENLSKLHVYAFGLIVTQGVALLYFGLRPRRVPVLLYTLAIQTPLWLVIYLILNGYIFEFRAVFLISMTYVIPTLALLVGEGGVSEPLEPEQGRIPSPSLT